MSLTVDTNELEAFVIAAKRATYVGSGVRAEPSRSGSHDLTFAQGLFQYRDSYFGGTAFVGQEVVWFDGNPVWAMSYYGYITRPELLDAAMAGATIKAALNAMYQEGRFLGAFAFTGPHGVYRDSSIGGIAHFHGRETITVGSAEAYSLDYFGGLIKP